MQPSSFALLADDTQILQAIFDAMPGNAVLVRPDAPRFTLLAVTPRHLTLTGHTKESLIGKGTFEAFPGSGANATNTGVSALEASYQYVLAKKEAHILPLQRYDLQNEDGSFSERYWRASNTPVFGADGEVAYILHSTEDITNEIKAREREEKMKGLEQAYGLFMQAPFAINIFTGPDLIIDLANPPTLELWGKTEDVTGRRFVDVLPELEGQGYDALMHEVMQTGIPKFFYEVPLRLNRPGKEPVGYFSFIYQPYYKGGAAKAESVLAIANEVTQQVLAKKSVEESEARFKAVVHQTPAPTLVLRGDDFVIEHINAPMLAMMGRGEEVNGQPFLSIMPELKGQYAWEQVQRVYHTGASFDQREVMVSHNRTGVMQDYYYNVAYRPLKLDGSITGIIQVAIDVTEQVMAKRALEESEDNLRNLVLQSPIGICVLNAATLVTEIVNDTYVAIAGKSYEAIYNRYFWDVFPEAAPYYEAALQGVIDSGKAFYANEVPLRMVRHSREEALFVTFVYEPLKDVSGTVKKVVVWALDNTPQVMARQKIEEVVHQRTAELQAINTELQRSNLHLEEFAHAASHDMKEPVRKIQYFTTRLEEELKELLSPQQTFVFGRVTNAAQRMGMLIDDLLLYSHVSERPREKEAVDLGEKVMTVLEDLELDVEQKAAVIKVGLLPTVDGHPRQLQQLFQNLISNGLKYSRAGVPPQITVTTSQATRNGRSYHLIEVADNGIGFNPEYAEKIFQMFSRLHGKGEYSGTGVGLAIVRKIVENHDGFIEAEGKPGEGATFRVYLPA